MTRKTAECANEDMVGGDWITRFEARTLDDIRAIVKPSQDDERRFAAVRRVSDINLGLYRVLAQPFVRAISNDQTAEWLQKMHPAELPYEVMSDRNPLMRQISGTRRAGASQRHPAPRNPWLPHAEYGFERESSMR